MKFSPILARDLTEYARTGPAPEGPRPATGRFQSGSDQQAGHAAAVTKSFMLVMPRTHWPQKLSQRRWRTRAVPEYRPPPNAHLPRPACVVPQPAATTPAVKDPFSDERTGQTHALLPLHPPPLPRPTPAHPRRPVGRTPPVLEPRRRHDHRRPRPPRHTPSSLVAHRLATALVPHRPLHPGLGHPARPRKDHTGPARRGHPPGPPEPGSVGAADPSRTRPAP